MAPHAMFEPTGKPQVGAGGAWSVQPPHPHSRSVWSAADSSPLFHSDLRTPSTRQECGHACILVFLIHCLERIEVLFGLLMFGVAAQRFLKFEDRLAVAVLLGQRDA
jgi:hypothetical protein